MSLFADSTCSHARVLTLCVLLYTFTMKINYTHHPKNVGNVRMLEPTNAESNTGGLPPRAADDARGPLLRFHLKDFFSLTVLIIIHASHVVMDIWLTMNVFNIPLQYC